MSSKDENFDLEKVYDEEIYPLMNKLIKISHEHKLPMFATFFFRRTDGVEEFCTTNILHEDDRPVNENMKKFARMIMHQQPRFMTIMTVTKNKEN